MDNRKKWGGYRIGARRPPTPKRCTHRIQYQQNWITPTDTTQYLVGPEGLVWYQPPIGEPFIIVANTDDDKANAAQLIALLTYYGDIPHGLSLEHAKQIAASNNGSLSNCKWVAWHTIPTPATTRPAVINFFA